MLEGQGREGRSQSDAGLVRGGDTHNILTNPLPFNIQNPYILKEMGVSYLAMKGSQNLKLSWSHQLISYRLSRLALIIAYEHHS